jgi:quercetin dioxygenase-like cupin family protein
MADINFTDFERQAQAEGFDEVLVREWAPNTVVDTHTHPFAVKALVVSGELWLTHEGATRHLSAGDRFELGLGVPHAERYGAQGTTFWAARRHPAPAGAA